ncbi:MAG: DUF1353 domain-containing protein [Alphaproteobacteria bacterium]
MGIALVIKDRLEEEHYNNIYKASNNKLRIKRPMIYKDITVWASFKFDGASIPWPVMFLFTKNDIAKGDVAACFHDWMCEHKHLYKRKYATHILLKLWKMAGLPSWKAGIIYACVEAYQMTQKGWKE